MKVSPYKRDNRIYVLRSRFNHFKRLENLCVQDTYDCVSDISNELQALGTTNVTDHEVMKKLVRLLDSSFDTLALMIQERTDYKELDPTDVLERLNTNELHQEEKRDFYGPNYRKSRFFI